MRATELLAAPSRMVRRIHPVVIVIVIVAAVYHVASSASQSIPTRRRSFVALAFRASSSSPGGRQRALPSHRSVSFRREGGRDCRPGAVRALGGASQRTPSPLDSPPIQRPPNNNATVTLRIPPFYDNGESNNNNSNDADASYNYPSPLHHIHVIPMLTTDEATTCLELSTSYAQQTRCWERPDYTRHASYATCDFCVDDCRSLQLYLETIEFQARIFHQLANLYGVDTDDLEFLDLFCAHYVAHDATTDDDRGHNSPTSASSVKQTMDRLEAHRDGSLLSFTVLLSPPSDFTGGGTFFDALRDVPPHDSDAHCLHEGGIVKPTRGGDAVVHSGKLLHGADAVTSGSRTVLVGFVTAERWERPGALAMACRDWGRMDVAVWRRNRHDQQCGQNGTGWFRSTLNQRWLPASSSSSSLHGRSYIRTYCPNFDAVWRRADPEFQRLQKLRAEDMLLRRILLDAPLDPILHPLEDEGDASPPTFDDFVVL